MRADSNNKPFSTRCFGRLVAATAALLLMAGLLSAPVCAQARPDERAAAGGPGAHASAGPQESGDRQHEDASDVSRRSGHDESAWMVIARLVNFAILVGVLLYYLRAPIANYLARRSTEIRSDLVTATETRQAAEAELASIDAKMKALPGEIEALKARGAAEIAAEEARIRQAADAERARLLDQARREIDLQLRVAERQLVKRAAELTVGLASDRIKRTITDDDQKRLVDQYLGQVGK